MQRYVVALDCSGRCPPAVIGREAVEAAKADELTERKHAVAQGLTLRQATRGPVEDEVLGGLQEVELVTRAET